MILAAIPFLPGVGTPELIIILVIVLVLFGPKKLPQLGKSLGKTMKSLRDGLEGKGEDEEEEPIVAAKADVPAKTAATDAGADESSEE